MNRIVMTIVCVLAMPVCWAADTTSSLKVTSQGKTKLTTGALIAGKVPGVRFQSNVPYLDKDRAEKLDLYLPADREKSVRSPAIVIIHGGGWVGGHKDRARELASGVSFAQAGYVAVSVEYMKTEGKRWPTNVHDCKNAVKWLRKNAADLQVDPNRIGVIGGSAGGHLALMTAYTDHVEALNPKSPYPEISSDNIRACVNMYGITNLITRQSTSKDGTPNGQLRGANALFKESRSEAPDKWKLASPISHVTKDSPPTMTIHGDADTTVDRDQAYELAEKLKSVGVQQELVVLKGVGHAFPLDDAKLPRDLRPEVLRFFDKHLK